MVYRRPYLHLESVTWRAGAQKIVDALSLTIHQGEFFTLLGPSGCGKTTTLRMIAGLECPESGRIWIDGQDATRIHAEDRSVGMVFQNYALFPHLSVFENVAFGCRVRKMTRKEIEDRVSELLSLVRLSGAAAKSVFELSGGQQQRVALARALAIHPKVLLLDEPFSHLDARLRSETREQVAAIVRHLEMTTLLVTHDRDEAFALSDRIALLDNGQVEQVGTPQQVYWEPRTLRAARFWGDANCLPAAALRDYLDRHGRICGGDLFPKSDATAFFRSEDVEILLSCSDADWPAPGTALVVEGVVSAVRYGGGIWECRVRTEIGDVMGTLPGREAPVVAGPCRLVIPWSSVHWISDNGTVKENR